MRHRYISFGMIIFIFADTLQAHFQQIRIMQCFRVVNFFPYVTIASPCPRTWNCEFLTIQNIKYNIVDDSKQWRRQIISFEQIHSCKVIHSQNFTGIYPSPVLMKLDARKCIILSCLIHKNKVEVFLLTFQ